MAILFNNLIVNKNSKKYNPFLLNLLSGRRKLLKDEEFALICSMLEKRDISYFNESEAALYNTLSFEKQFVNDENRADIENVLMESSHYDVNNKGIFFTLEVCRNCNMRCSYCMVKEHLNDDRQMTKEHIDAIYDLYHKYLGNQCDTDSEISIGITGGEALINQTSVDVINYVVKKWPRAKLVISTNGVNLLEYYDKLPISALKEVNISLDGTKEIHLQRRYSGINVDGEIYDEIIGGIKKLLSDKIPVNIKSLIDKHNYTNRRHFKDMLLNEGISTSPFFKQSIGMVIDYEDPLNLHKDYNTKDDVYKIREHLESCDMGGYPLFDSASVLYQALSRPRNEPPSFKHQRCKSGFLSNYYFSCDGNMYLCACVKEGRGVLGTYYPAVSIDNDAVDKMKNRSVMLNEKCRPCPYKFVCLGGCPLSSTAKGTDMDCGIFADDDILDNLEFNFGWIPNEGATST